MRHLKPNKRKSVNLPSLAGLAVEAGSVPISQLPPLSAFRVPPATKANLLCPINLDSEFVDRVSTRLDPLAQDQFVGVEGVSIQIRGVAQPNGFIFAHPNQPKPRHEVLGAHDCIVADWLIASGVERVAIYADAEKYRALRHSFRIQVIAHYALADIRSLAGTGEFENTIVQLYATKKLVMNRRLVARASANEKAKSGVVSLNPWVISIDNHEYRLTLEIFDTNGLHGIASYADLLKNVGIETSAKELITRKGPNADILRMDEIYHERPADFDEYALGDLLTSDILYKYYEQWAVVYKSHNIEHRYQPPKLTIGGSVADLIRVRIRDLLNVNEDDESFIENTTGTHNAEYLARFAKEKSALALLAKVDGGRCRNSKPLVSTMRGALCDIDIAGAYASAMTQTPLIIGKPRQSVYSNHRDLKPDLTKCPTLAEWLRTHVHRLIDRTWYARVNTITPFSFESDLIPSWINYRLVTRKSDTENAAFDHLTDPASGIMRYLSREIWAGTLTSDLLDVARCTMSPIRFKEWSEKIVIRAALYVDRKDELSISEFADRYKRDELKEFHWCAVTLGYLVSDSALANRLKYQKQHGKGSPLDQLFKLISNTTYGDSVSRFFETSSVISGSNVTATVRSFMYLVEKGLNLVGSITDGQLFDLNGVFHSQIDKGKMRRPSDKAMESRAYMMSSREYERVAKAKLRSLTGELISLSLNDGKAALKIDHRNGTIETAIDDDAKRRIDELAYQHLSQLWPSCKLISDTFKKVEGLDDEGHVIYTDQKGIFRFETKELIGSAVLHGSANYWHMPVNPAKQKQPRMRSYEGSKKHRAFTLDPEKNLIYLPTYDEKSPAEIILGAIAENPRKVPILPPFVKTRILKPGVFQTNKKYTGEGVLISPGDSVYVIGRPRYFSLAQFTFKTRSQYSAWSKATTRLLNRYGLTFELWFADATGDHIDYQSLLETVEKMIVADVANPIAWFDKKRNRRLSDSAMRMHKAKDEMKKHLDSRLIDDDYSNEYVEYDDREVY